MTGQNNLTRCAWCGQRFAQSPGPGRKRKYCRRSHRQRHFEARRIAADHGLGEDEVVWRRSDLQRLRDAIYLLEAAADDARVDLDDDDSREGHAAVVGHLLSAIDGLVRVGVGPIALTD